MTQVASITRRISPCAACAPDIMASANPGRAILFKYADRPARRESTNLCCSRMIVNEQDFPKKEQRTP
jgi:hypothetical protein